MTTPKKHAGIIAAGHGSRLHATHPQTPKPLVIVQGKPLVHWVVSSLCSTGVDALTILLNSRGDAVRRYLEKEFTSITWDFLREDTASSWESFRLVSRRIAEKTAHFHISTVDALIPPKDAQRFIQGAFLPLSDKTLPEAALALTGYVDDEKPLWADIDKDGIVSAIGAQASRKDAVTCGLYALSRPLAQDMPVAAQYSRLRDYWTHLISNGTKVRGIRLTDTVDVDRPEDFPAAEKVTSCFSV